MEEGQFFWPGNEAFQMYCYVTYFNRVSEYGLENRRCYELTLAAHDGK